MISRPRGRLVGCLLGLAVLAGVGYTLWWRTHPSPCPYSQRYWIGLPRPIITRSRLRGILRPQSDDRILEVGPGTGYYALPVARWLEPDGALHVVDIQQEMLDHTRIRAQQERLKVEPMRGDAENLPYLDDSFDAAYLVTVLGEVPDQNQALRELIRVLRPGGRLVVGELVPDPHFVAFEALRHRAERRGFQFTERAGNRFGYFARFRVPKRAAN
ncbi:class I SAM-dependent methyltransferase [Halegenticoccus soli]|uniref:class I SAM-dependent methyltransferase n=1 Tax=Halegenticoccus soli TaxID=1985678 RepID=UPI000C6E5331|nr:class I SAM-dependent methyltransferase [Halegenticoccus soli]